MKDSEKDWLEQRIILVVKGTIDEYVSIESRVRTRHFVVLYLSYPKAEAQMSAFYMNAKFGPGRPD